MPLAGKATGGRGGGGERVGKWKTSGKGGKEGGWMDGPGICGSLPVPPPPSPFRSHRRLRQSTTTLYGTHERESLFYNPLCLPLPPFAGRKKRDPPTVQPVQEESLYLCLFLPKKSFLFLPPEKRCGNRQMSFGYHFQKNRIPSLGESGIGCKSFFFSARKSCNFQLRREIDGGGSEMEARGGEEG